MILPGIGMMIPPADAVALTYATWNPSDKSAGITLSSGNTVATHTGSNGATHGVRGNQGKSTGKWYGELTITSITDDDDIRLGIANASASLTTLLGADTNSWSFEQVNTAVDAVFRKRTNNSATNLTSTGQLGVNGTVVMMAWDADAGKLWFGVNGTWMNPDGNPGAGNPAAGTNPTFSSVTGTLYPMITMTRSSTANVVTANFGASAFAYTAPSGFSGWGI